MLIALAFLDIVDEHLRETPLLSALRNERTNVPSSSPVVARIHKTQRFAI